MPITQLLVATRNRDKAKEFQDMVRDLGLEVLTLHDIPGMGEIVEDALTLEENALKKAHEAFRHSGIPSLGDDTGLEVHYLNDEPGVRSSRYAGPGATYADNCQKLLRKLRGVPPRRRGARFRCALAFVSHGDIEEVVEGTCAGVILEQPRGSNGFGYDPVFLPAGHTQTFAEMESSLKNSISHRGLAFQSMRRILVKYTGR